MAAVLQRRPARASDHAAAGSHAVRDSRRRGRRALEGESRCHSDPWGDGNDRHAPRYLGDLTARGAYFELLRMHAEDASAWRALPRDVAEWWRRRAATTIQRTETGWQAVGPAQADAMIDFVPSQAA